MESTTLHESASDIDARMSADVHGFSNAEVMQDYSEESAEVSDSTSNVSSAQGNEQTQMRTTYSSVVVQDVYLAMLALYVSHVPTESFFADIVRIVNILIPNEKERLPVKLEQFLQRSIVREVPVRHYYCHRPTCSDQYVGSADGKCVICGSQPHAQSYFLYSSVQSYLRVLLQDGDLHEYLLGNTRMPTNGTYRDVSDGSEFKRVQATSPGSVQLLLNVDGVPLYNTTSVSLHPVTICPINYPMSLRRKRMHCCILWSDKKKPNYFHLLDPFIKEMRLLGSDGLFWRKDNQLMNTKVFLTLVTADSVARAPLQQLQQFNGKYGCPVCITPSTPVKKSNALHRIYTYRAEPVMRNSADTMRIAKSAIKVSNLLITF